MDTQAHADSVAYELGCAAGLVPDFELTNPYPDNSEEHVDWDIGYHFVRAFSQ